MVTKTIPQRFLDEAVFLLYLAIDVVLFNVGIVAAFYIRFLGHPPSGNVYSYLDLLSLNIRRGIFPFALLIPAVIFSAFEIYRRNWFNEKIEEYIHLIQTVALSTVMLLVTTYTYRHVAGSFPTSVVFISFFINCYLICQWRLAVRYFYRKRLYSRLGEKNLLFVGISGMDPESLSRIRSNYNPSYNVVGYLQGRTERDVINGNGIPCVGWTDRLVDTIAQYDVDEIMISTSVISNEESVSIIHECELIGIRYRIVPSLFDMVMSRARVDLLNFVPIIHFGEPRIEGFSSIFKRLVDFVVATTLLVFLAPFLLAVMAWIRLDSKGSPLFIQNRIGRDGKPFAMFKFRTMKVGSEDGAPLTKDGDNRVTGVGRILRRTSVDELPQLLNVIKGDMSLVGPRAVVPFVADQFDDLERTALAVLPGMSGLAQVYGRDELSFRDKSLLNIYYIRNYSFMLDMKILLKTLGVVLSAVGTDGTHGAKERTGLAVAPGADPRLTPSAPKHPAPQKPTAITRSTR